MLLKCDIGCAVKALLTLSVISKCENVLEIEVTICQNLFNNKRRVNFFSDLSKQSIEERM